MCSSIIVRNFMNQILGKLKKESCMYNPHPDNRENTVSFRNAPTLDIGMVTNYKDLRFFMAVLSLSGHGQYLQ
jgi:hypothetical protein